MRAPSRGLGLLSRGQPRALCRLLERCLRKDPKLRLRDIGEARIILDEPEPAAAPVPTRPRAWLAWTIAVLAIASRRRTTLSSIEEM